MFSFSLSFEGLYQLFDYGLFHLLMAQGAKNILSEWIEPHADKMRMQIAIQIALAKSG
jgi:hypothetical protein